MKKLVTTAALSLAIIILLITVNLNKYETIGDILENVENDYGKIVSFLIVKDNYDENRKRERYGIVGDDIPTFVEEVSSLEINSSNGSDTEILYPIIIHTKTEEGFPQVTITITNNGLVFDGKEYKFEKPDKFEDIINHIIDNDPYHRDD
ncbi:hypothetical protein ACTHQ4_16530 [Alkalicoccobacillus gibsonii]|uniref:hypothetical protein n=1 Tax=Alkalicoccobacillus gibsonii TaxID=79881 RepID=UPI003F7BA37D